MPKHTTISADRRLIDIAKTICAMRGIDDIMKIISILVSEDRAPDLLSRSREFGPGSFAWAVYPVDIKSYAPKFRSFSELGRALIHREAVRLDIPIPPAEPRLLRLPETHHVYLEQMRSWGWTDSEIQQRVQEAALSLNHNQLKRVEGKRTHEVWIEPIPDAGALTSRELQHGIELASRARHYRLCGRYRLRKLGMSYQTQQWLTDLVRQHKTSVDILLELAAQDGYLLQPVKESRQATVKYSCPVEHLEISDAQIIAGVHKMAKDLK